MSVQATDRPYTVVVGVSATSRSPAALVWAAAQAKVNHGHLIAVRVLKRNTPHDESASQRSGSDQGEGPTGLQADLEADVAEALGSEHEAECRVLYGGKRNSLLAVAHGADLLVIDAARTPSAASRLAHRIIAAAGCPVVVLPPALTGEPLSGMSRAGRAMGEAALRAAGTSGRPGYRPPDHT